MAEPPSYRQNRASDGADLAISLTLVACSRCARNQAKSGVSAKSIAIMAVHKTSGEDRIGITKSNSLIHTLKADVH